MKQRPIYSISVTMILCPYYAFASPVTWSRSKGTATYRSLLWPWVTIKAPTLAIIYMNNLDLEIRSSFNSIQCILANTLMMFIAWTKDTLTPDEMLTTANSINTALKFTVEIPEDNCLPFLDIIVTFHPHNGRFSTKLYMKPIHSQCITSWDSHGPISMKRGILIGEIRRAMSRSTDPR